MQKTRAQARSRARCGEISHWRRELSPFEMTSLPISRRLVCFVRSLWGGCAGYYADIVKIVPRDSPQARVVGIEIKGNGLPSVGGQVERLLDPAVIAAPIAAGERARMP